MLSAGPVSTFSLLRPSGSRVELSRGGNELPSRVADNLFWIGRYAERAEGVARMLRGVLVRMTDKQGLHEVSELPVLIRALAHLCGGGSGDAKGEQDDHEFVSALIHDPKQPGGLPAIFQALTRLRSRAVQFPRIHIPVSAADGAGVFRAGTFQRETGSGVAGDRVVVFLRLVESGLCGTSAGVDPVQLCCRRFDCKGARRWSDVA